MRKVRMDKHTDALAPGTWTAGWNLMPLILRHDVCMGRLGLCEIYHVEGAVVLLGVMEIELGSPKAIDVPSCDADALLAANFSHTSDGWHRCGDRGRMDGERPWKDRVDQEGLARHPERPPVWLYVLPLVLPSV